MELIMSTRVIVYARVSTTRQAEHDLSIPDQLSHAERYCSERGYGIVARYVDPGASARDDNRPEFQRMLADIKAGVTVAELLLVHSLSRFFRGSFGFAFYCRELGKYGVRVVSATQELSDDANGALMRNVLSAFDEYTSLETAKHVTRSMLENARRGFWNGAIAPFGYRIVTVERHGNKDKKKLTIEAKEAEIVKLIFRLYLFGDGKTGPLGIKDITSYLNANGFTERSGKPFRIQFVHKMLTRLSYTGTHYFNRRDSRSGKPKAREEWIAIEVPRLVEEDVFHAVQSQLKARHPKITAPRIVKSEILLTGIARCEHCSAQMRIRTGKSGRYLYYACSRKTDIGQAGCVGLSIPMKQLDDIVTDAVCDKVLEPSRLTTMVGALVARNARHQDRQRAELRDLFGRQRELSTQIKNLIDVMEKGGLGSLPLVQDRLAARQSELDEVSRLIALKKRVLETPIANVTAEKTQLFATAFRQHLRSTDNSAFRRAYLRLMLDKVIVGKNAIHISGPKAVLAHHLTAEKPLPPSLVPTFVDGWRTRQDSNL
jgi:site-specific DNA recombinase